MIYKSILCVKQSEEELQRFTVSENLQPFDRVLYLLRFQTFYSALNCIAIDLFIAKN